MRIGIDVTSWINQRGFGRVTRSLVQALIATDRTNEYVLFFDGSYDQCGDVPSAARHVIVRTAVAQSNAIGMNCHRSLADMVRMTSTVAREPLDLFFCPSIDGYFPVVRPAARLVMIHDVIPERLGRTALPNKLSRWRRRIKVRFAIRQASLVATTSRYTSAQLRDVFGISADRIAIVPPGVSDHFRPAEDIATVRAQVMRKHAFSGRFFLNVGGVGPHKNIPLLLDAFAGLLRARPSLDVKLVFAGSSNSAGALDTAEVDCRLRLPELAGRVVFLGTVPDAELVALYQSADALVLPSVMEGFGLPALEAVCCGTPAIGTTASPLPELLGDAVLEIEPNDGAALRRAMQRVLDGSAPRPAPDLHNRFTWQRSAAAALEAFDRAAHARRR